MRQITWAPTRANQLYYEDHIYRMSSLLNASHVLNLYIIVVISRELIVKNNNKMRYYEIDEKRVDKILCSSVFLPSDIKS